MDISSLTFQTRIPDCLLNSRIKEWQVIFPCFCKNTQRKQEAQSQRAVSEYNLFKRAEEKRNKECASSGVWCFASKLTWEISPLFNFCIRIQFKGLMKWNFAGIPLSTIRRLEFWWASKPLDSFKMSSLDPRNISVYSAIDQLIVFFQMSLCWDQTKV